MNMFKVENFTVQLISNSLHYQST